MAIFQGSHCNTNRCPPLQELPTGNNPMSASPITINRNYRQQLKNSNSARLVSNSSHLSQSPQKKTELKLSLQEDVQNPNLSKSLLLPAIVSHKFSNSERFPVDKNMMPSPQFCASPSSFSLKRGPTMGFGDRSELIIHQSKDTAKQPRPSPLAYLIKSEFDNGTKKGKSFGLPHSVYEKVYMEGSKEMPLPTSKNIPGVGSYDISKDVLAGKGKVSFQARGKMFNEGLGLDSPNCNKYSPRHRLVQPAKHNSPGFGFGKKYDFTKKKDNYPGPSDYTPNIFKKNFSRRDISPKVGGH